MPVWLAVLTPAALMNIWAGHYGFLIGALFLLGWERLDKRPWLAGLLFGLLLIKPHLAILVPLVLLLRAQWSALLSGALTVAVLVAATSAIYGWGVWEQFLFGAGQVSTYVILGMGEDPQLTIDGCKRAIDLGVYPFVVPIRPVPGTLLEHTPTPDPDYVADIYRSVSAMLAESGLDHSEAAAGCARCQACSGLSAWERVFENQGLIVHRLGAALTNEGRGFAPGSRIFRFLNNNDTRTRFITSHGENLTRVATALVLTLPGIPCIYTADGAAQGIGGIAHDLLGELYRFRHEFIDGVKVIYQAHLMSAFGIYHGCGGNHLQRTAMPNGSAESPRRGRTDRTHPPAATPPASRISFPFAASVASLSAA